MNRAKIEDALLAMGAPAGNRGFRYIADAIEIFEAKGMDIGVTKELYPEIGKKYNVTATSAERAIRHSFEVARNRKECCETVSHYIGFINCENSNSLKRLYMMLKREEEK